MIRQQEDELELELPFSEEELKEKYEKFSISLMYIFYYTEDLIPISCRWTFYTPPQIWWRAGERHGRPHFPAFVQDDEGELGLGYFHAFSILLAIVCFCHTIVRYLNCHLQVLVKRKITVPGSFIGHSTTPAVSCSYKVVKKKLPFLSTSLLHRRHPGSFTLWKGAWFSSTSLPFLSNTRISSQSTLPGIYTWNALSVNDEY